MAMDDLTGEFVSETRETLEHIAEALVAWESHPADSARLDEIFRFVHTVKGSCGFLNLPRIEGLAHAAETALAGVRDGTRTADSALVGTMLAIIDRIGSLVASLDKDSGVEVPAEKGDAALIDALDRRVVVEDAGSPFAPAQARTVRIGVPLLESMMNQVSELVLVRNELARSLRGRDDRELEARFERLGGIVADLRDSVTRTRMQPIDRLFATLPRLVRDTARECGKSVVLDVGGQDVEIDREMVESIRDPLIHIVRNAIDHGIESPAERLQAGKPEAGTIHIVALQSGNQVSIEVSDDGRGIDTARLIEKAVAAKIVDRVRAGSLDATAAAALMFEPGLSTAETITNISGRGVGMDVVRANVERLGGSVALVNRPGAGLTITLKAPLTLSIVNALIVVAGGQRFAIPRGVIEEVVPLRAGGARLDDLGGGKVVVVRGVAHPAFLLAALLGIEAELPALAIMVTTPAGGHYALIVDGVTDHEELVVRPMAPQLASRGIFAGQSLGDDGRPVVVLDPTGLAVLGGLQRTGLDNAVPVQEAAVVAPASVLVATGFDGSRIAVRAAMIERLIETDRRDWAEIGKDRFVVVDGRHLVAAPGGTLPEHGAIPALILSDGSRRAVLGLQAVHDLSPIPEVIAVGNDAAEGLLRINGQDVLLIDAFKIFARAPAPLANRPVALIALDPSPWARAMLAPLIAAAGYDVRFESCEDADLVIHLDGEDAPIKAKQHIALATADNGSVAVDRYDRATLLKLVASGKRRRA
jgi:two-component system chemotaxis sensor kinase CheA